MPTFLTSNTPAIVVEIFVTGIVLGLQFYHFFRTYRKIGVFKRLFPDAVLEEKNVVAFVGEAEEEEEISLIRLENNQYSEGFVRIVDLINRYLEKNKHAADFGIIRSIVDSNMAVHEEDITSSVSLPLYIGLMGTFAGVALGLITIAIHGAITEDSINTFITGVIIAMTASFMGLLLTVTNNAGGYKQAKSLNESRKNGFFNFLRIHLLPYIGNDLSNVVNTFRDNINRFNKNFGKNLTLFDEKLSDNVRTLGRSVSSIAEKINPLIENTHSNQKILQHLQSAEFRELAATNVQLLTVIGNAVPKLVEFSRQQEDLSHSISKMAEAVAGIDSVMNRIRRFEENINAFGERIDTADYLGSDLLEKVNRKLDSLDKEFELLKQHSQTAAGQIEHHFVQEQQKIEDLSVRTLSELQGALNFNIEQNPLKKLEQLDTIAATLNGILLKIGSLPAERGRESLLPANDGRSRESGYREQREAGYEGPEEPDNADPSDGSRPQKNRPPHRKSFWRRLFSSSNPKRGRED